MGVDHDAVGGYGYSFSFNKLDEGFINKNGKETFEKYDENIYDIVDSDEFKIPQGFVYNEYGDRSYTGDTENSGFVFTFKGNDIHEYGSPEPLIEWIYNTFGIEVNEKPKIILEVHTW